MCLCVCDGYGKLPCARGQNFFLFLLLFSFLFPLLYLSLPLSFPLERRSPSHSHRLQPQSLSLLAAPAAIYIPVSQSRRRGKPGCSSL